MKHTFKRTLSLLLSLVLVLSLVPATVFATEAETAYAAVNTTTGVTYDLVGDALDAAQAGQTIQVTKDTEDHTVLVDEDITLDLNGYQLDASYVIGYGQIIDSSEGTTGYLVVSPQRLLVRSDNLQLPVKDGEGYRFVEVIGFNATMINENKYAFQPLFEADAHEYLVSAESGVSIQVDVSWKQAGAKLHIPFEYSDAQEVAFINSYKPATGKYGKMFTLTQLSKGYYEDLGFEALVVSDTGVVFGAGITRPEIKEDGKVEVDSDNKLVGDVTVTNPQGSATIQAGTQLEDASSELKLTTSRMDKTGTDLTLDENETLDSFDIHVSGIAKENTVPVIITLNKLAPEFLNKGNLELYHVENGETVPMTRVYTLAEVDAHNEYYYDIITGTVTVAMSSFSEVAVAANTKNVWNGNFENFTGSGTEEDPYIIANADQLAQMSKLVSEDENYAKANYKLIADVNFGGYNNVLTKVTPDKKGTFTEDVAPYRVFYPIGYWKQLGTYTYTYAGEETADFTNGQSITQPYYGFGNAFRGTFDGTGHTVKGLCQRTWDMAGTYEGHYWNHAHGLFGAVYDAKIMNLVIDDFQSDGEFTPTGCVAAYAGGESHFENITLLNCNPRVYNTGNGGIVGLNYNSTSGKADHLYFKNITVDNSNKISALWGSWDVACAGIVGRIRENSKHNGTNTLDNMNTVTFENCHVAAQIDVFNDVCGNYQYYQYRYCGMLVGTVDYMDEIPGVELKDMFLVKNADSSVHFGDWNEYWYCELVENSLASYTHDHQMSRLDKITNVKEIQDENGNWNRAGNFVIPNADETKAQCFHIRKNADGTFRVHNHADSGFETFDLDKNGQLDDLKEDIQHIMIPFHQMCAGYGWGASHEYLFTTDNGTNSYGIKVLDYNGSKSIYKFESLFANGNKHYNTGDQVTLDKMFKIKDGADLTSYPIDMDNVQVTVSPADENSTVSANYVRDDTDWTKSQLTFTGHGYAEIIIQDYHFCQPTYLYVYVDPTVKLELVSHAIDSGDAKHTEGTRVDVQLIATGDLTLAKDSSISVPAPAKGWTFVSDVATYENGKITVTDDLPIGKDYTNLGYFMAAKDFDAANATISTTALKVLGAKELAPANLSKQTNKSGHSDAWKAWNSATTLPTESGRYYLTKDVHLTTQASATGLDANNQYVGRDITLCLGGYDVYVDSNYKTNSNVRDRIYSVRNGAVVTICDCTAHGDPKNGTYDAGKLLQAEQGALMIPTLLAGSVDTKHADSVINFYDGIITDCNLSSDGAAVLSQAGATVNMYGGLITGNTNQYSESYTVNSQTGKTEWKFGGRGAGIYVGGGATFNMDGGAITNNKAVVGAGVVAFGNSKVNIANAYFAGNETLKDWTDEHQQGKGEGDYAFDEEKNLNSGAGAALYISSASLNVQNSVFENNKAWIRGGAIFTNSNDVSITGSTFTGNEVLEYKYKKSAAVAPDGDGTGNGGQEAATIDEDVGVEDGEGNTGTGSDMEGGSNTGTALLDSTGSGGAIYMNHVNEGSIVTNCTFQQNRTALNGGAIAVMNYSNVVLDTVTVSKNVIGASGGAGLYAAGFSRVTLQGASRITGNYGSDLVKNSSAGLYMANGLSTVVIKDNSVITGNGNSQDDGKTFARSLDIYLQDNAGRTYVVSSSVDENGKVTEETAPVPNPVLYIRDLKSGAQMNVYSATEHKDLSWLNWKGGIAGDYGTWDQSYIRFTAKGGFAPAILENKTDRELYFVENHKAHKVNGAEVEWTMLNSTNTLPAESGYYVLTKDVTLTTAVALSSAGKNVVLCLNGHKIDASKAARAYTLTNGAKLTICDCNATHGTILTGKGNDQNDYAKGGAFIAAKGTELTLRNVTVSGANHDDAQDLAGGGIYAVSAKVTVEDNCVFTDLKLTPKAADDKNFGAAINISGDGSSLIMKDSAIRNCQSAVGSAIRYNGGRHKKDGVENAGPRFDTEFVMDGVTVEYCDHYGTARSDAAAGAVFYLRMLENVSFTNCTIKNNSSRHSNGIIYLTDSLITLKNCTITDNTIRSTGDLNYVGALYLMPNSQATLIGKNDISGNTAITSKTTVAVTQRESNILMQNSQQTVLPLIFKDVPEGHVYSVNTTYKLSGTHNTIVKDANGKDVTVHVDHRSLTCNDYWQVKDTETPKSFIVYHDYASIDQVGHTFLYNVKMNEFVQSGHTSATEVDYHKDDAGADAQWTPWFKEDILPNESGNYYLTCNVNPKQRMELNTVNGATKEPVSITLCLNGYTISGDSMTSSKWGGVYYIKGEEHKITICDCSHHVNEQDGTYVAGKITGFSSAIAMPADSTQNARTVITIRDGIFTKNINDSTAPSGSVITAQSGANVYIMGGVFTENQAKEGGAVYVSGGNLTIEGSSFTGNEAIGGKGGGIYFKGNGKTFTLNGNVTVTGNTDSDTATNADDIYVESGSFISKGVNTIGKCNKTPTQQ